MSYRLRYTLAIEAGQFEREDVRGEDDGLTDALILISTLYEDDGSSSQAVVSKDGRTGTDVSSADLWKAWALLAHDLSRRQDLDPGKRDQCRDVFEAVRTFVLAARAKVP